MEGGCYLQLPDGTRVKSDENGVPLDPPNAAPAAKKSQPVAPTAADETTTATTSGEGSK